MSSNKRPAYAKLAAFQGFSAIRLERNVCERDVGVVHILYDDRYVCECDQSPIRMVRHDQRSLRRGVRVDVDETDPVLEIFDPVVPVTNRKFKRIRANAPSERIIRPAAGRKIDIVIDRERRDP